MHVVIVDCNQKRHDRHEQLLRDLNLSDFEIKRSIDISSIPEMNTDILVIHKNNDEFSQIESGDNFGKIRIFFSDGYYSDYIKDNYNYYVPFEDIEKTLSNILLKMEKCEDL